jgi:hypothetical protein
LRITGYERFGEGGVGENTAAEYRDGAFLR